MLYLTELLHPPQVQLHLHAREKGEVLQELVQIVPELKNNQPQQEVLLKALRDREKLHTTAIGDEIALPHARNPGVLTRPALIFGRHSSGVDFGSLDGRPVKLFFLFAAPDLTQHLAILARLSRVLRDPALRQTLLTCAGCDQVISSIREAELRITK